jgi:3-deoxy-manno-octulosonate cytidylyltransferase (CMP-KDO synthetase)
MKIVGIIPARYASTRFPGKPLVDIGCKPMIRRVYEQAKQAKSLAGVIVATDDERIYNTVLSFGGKAMMTSSGHVNGTERCAEAAAKLDADVIVNIQGDEPFIHPEQIDLAAKCFEKPDTQIATLIKQHVLNSELQNPSRVKVVVNSKMQALYFSRSIIPYQRNTDTNTTYFKHIGLYAYRADVLAKIVKLNPSPLEIAESLEQLRWLENGYTIQCAETPHESLSIDTPEDLRLVTHLL